MEKELLEIEKWIPMNPNLQMAVLKIIQSNGSRIENLTKAILYIQYEIKSLRERGY